MKTAIPYHSILSFLLQTTSTSLAPSTLQEPRSHVSPTQTSGQSVTVNLKQNTNLNTQDLYTLGNNQASQLQNVKISFFDQHKTPQSSTKENIDPNTQNRSLQKGQSLVKKDRILPSPSQYEIHKSLYPQTINQTKVIY